MKKVFWFALSTIILLFIGIQLYLIILFSNNLSNIPEGEFLTKKVSPSAEYTLNVYYVDGGATTAGSIRGELVYNKKNIEPKNIYWNYREYEAIIEWVDEDTVLINGKEIDVLEETFDFRTDL